MFYRTSRFYYRNFEGDGNGISKTTRFLRCQVEIEVPSELEANSNLGGEASDKVRRVERWSVSTQVCPGKWVVQHS